MKLILDNREQKLINALNGKLTFEVKQLDLGDIIIIGDDEKIELIIERKTVSDLYSSIIDGRLSSQKSRLSTCGIPSEKICFLIEYPFNVGLLSKEKLISSNLLSLSFKYNFKVIFSNGIPNTGEIISMLIDKYINLNGNGNCLEIGGLLSKSNFLSDKLFINQLTLFKGVSLDIAKSIKQVYPNFVELINAYESLACEKERGELLIGLKITEKRKIGKVLSKKFYEQLYEK
jgi:ERCC4-type nuclease